MLSRIVYYDTETTGLDPKVHQVIQWAGVATEDGKELETLEVKLTFDEAKATKEALEINHYDPAVWKAQAVAPTVAINRIGSFLKKHSTVELMSKKNTPYKVAQGSGYNTSFDMDFTKALFAQMSAFLPLSWRGLDVMSLAMWHFSWATERHEAACDGALKADCLRVAPKDFKLTSVAAHLGILVDGDAHDALVDARLAWNVAERLRPLMEVAP